jgi:hypothetical protein
VPPAVCQYHVVAAGGTAGAAGAAGTAGVEARQASGVPPALMPWCARNCVYAAHSSRKCRSSSTVPNAQTRQTRSPRARLAARLHSSSKAPTRNRSSAAKREVGVCNVQEYAASPIQHLCLQTVTLGRRPSCARGSASAGTMLHSSSSRRSVQCWHEQRACGSQRRRRCTREPPCSCPAAVQDAARGLRQQ